MDLFTHQENEEQREKLREIMRLQTETLLRSARESAAMANGSRRKELPPVLIAVLSVVLGAGIFTGGMALARALDRSSAAAPPCSRTTADMTKS